jgi:hypothetical protein
VDGQPAAALGDDPGALQHRQEAAGGLARGTGQLRQFGLRGGHEHVRGPPAGGDLLFDQLAEHHRHAALHRLEGLARETLVGLAQAPAERDHQAHRDPGVLAHQPAHVAAEHAHHARRLDRFHGRRAQLVLEHRQLAEDVTRPERRQRDRASVPVCAGGAGVALADDVAGVAGVALAEDDLTGLEAARHRHLGDSLQVADRERGEHGHPAEQLDHVS